MFRETLEIFRKNIEQYGEQYVLDNYVPKNGTYRLIEMTGASWTIGEPLQIFYDKKKEQLEGLDSPQYSYFRFLDYYSKLIDMNKPVDPRKIIHSNNYFTFFIKKESIPKFSEEVVDEYYNILRDPNQKYKKNSKTLYQTVEERLGKVNESLLTQIHGWLSENFKSLTKDLSGTDYFKLFFVFPDREETKKAYMREGDRYLLPNIYNSNDFNQIVDGEIMGLPNDNMGMNAKKPYLANLSRKVQVPYLLKQEDVLCQAKFFDFLMGCASKGRVNIYFDAAEKKILALKSGEHPPNALSGYFLRIKKGKEVEIQNADTVVCYNPNLMPAFYYKGILKEEKDDRYGVVSDRRGLEDLFSDILFGNSLIPNYFTEPQDLKIPDGTVRNQMLAIRERLFSWFYKNDGTEIGGSVREAAKILIKNSIRIGNWKKARKQINFLWSLEDYLERNKQKEEIMNQAMEQLQKHMDDKSNWEYSSDEEYYFAVGQLVSYFITKSNSKKKPLSFVNPFLNAGNDGIVKKHLEFLFKKYNYDIEYYKDMRVRRLYSNAMLYQPKKAAVDTIMLSAGVTADNCIFMKSEGAENDSLKERQGE